MVIEKKLDAAENCWRIQLFGDIDIYNAPELKKELLGATDADICLDCAHLKYIDSTGLGVLVAALKELQKKQHGIVIRGLKPHLYKLFTLTNLHTLFTIEEPSE